MTTIGFIRHGITHWNKEGRTQGSLDIPLNEDGIQMAERVARRLMNEQWDAIYASPLLRAKKTAEIIAEKNPGIDLILDNRLRELGEGKAEGTTEAERIEMWGEAWRELDMRFEPHDKAIARGMAFIEEIKMRHRGQKVLVVSHGSFIYKLMNELVPHENLRNNLGNTSITLVKLQKTVNYCKLYNCMEHLKGIN